MMATRHSNTGNAKPVPSWLNSPAWSSKPRAPGRPRAASENLSKEKTGSKPLRDEESKEADERPEISFWDNGTSKGYKSKITGDDFGNEFEEELYKHENGAAVYSSGKTQGPLLSPKLSGRHSAAGLDDARSQSLSSAGSCEVENGPRRTASLDHRVGQFADELSRKRILLGELQRLASQGIPDLDDLRAKTWKILLGYLPRSRDEWKSELGRKRLEYSVFKDELILNPTELTRRKSELEAAAGDEDVKGFLLRQDITHDDHPLSLGKSSVWHQYFQDAELSEQIDRDVKRTHPDMHFFCGDTPAALENQECLKRVLFIFAKLNPGIRYVQGMNEVLAPLFYVFRTDSDESNSSNAEADSFFCFVELLSDFRDHFCQQLDNSAVGIRSTIAQLNTLLRRHDEELWRHLELTTKVNPQFYAFRWITLLLTQEFSFPDSLRLWDSFLSNPDGPLEILLRVCCAMLISVRDRLLAGDFTSNLKLLQHYPSMDVRTLLAVAEEVKG
eukprot:TRINITY_DN12543_c0_g1_i1.p1 TRINITY_DN12543_c0_g1~~TRINITY_DN12543_c0_g1_i1.p1  ORF type:complete len:502 (+),score=64.57 TRINITY_DN12543_c0_g1_i1:464-1969(+)